MAVTITKMTNGFFLFESNTDTKRGSSNPVFDLRNNQLRFFTFHGDPIEGFLDYTEITLYDGASEITGITSSEEMADELVGLGMKMQ